MLDVICSNLYAWMPLEKSAAEIAWIREEELPGDRTRPARGCEFIKGKHHV